MDKKIIIIIILTLSIIATVFLLNRYGFSQMILMPFWLILFSLLFFSRGILIFLTTLCLLINPSHVDAIKQGTDKLRWVFFTIFTLHVFGDIFLGRTVRRLKAFDVLAIFFICYAFISCYYAPYPYVTLERSTSLLLLYISVFWIVWKYVYTEGPEKVIYLILRSAMIVFVASYLIIFIGRFQPFRGQRFQGIFENPNTLGIVAALFLPITLWQLLVSKKVTALLLFLLMFVGLLLSGSRSSLNAAVFSIAYFIYASSKKIRPLVFFISVAFLLIFVWGIETLGTEYFMNYIRVATLKTGGGRFERWSQSLALIVDKPIFGYGFGMEGLIFGYKGIYVRTTHDVATGLTSSYDYSISRLTGYTHNAYLGILIQLGIVGFIIFFFPLFILLFKELFSKRDDETPLLRYALRASLLSGLVSSIFESGVYSVGNVYTFHFWIIVMLLVFYRYQDKGKIIVEGT